MTRRAALAHLLILTMRLFAASPEPVSSASIAPVVTHRTAR
jgi:hypothetical protein